MVDRVVSYDETRLQIPLPKWIRHQFHRLKSQNNGSRNVQNGKRTCWACEVRRALGLAHLICKYAPLLIQIIKFWRIRYVTARAARFTFSIDQSNS